MSITAAQAYDLDSESSVVVYLQRNKHLVVKFISIIAALKFDLEAGHSSIISDCFATVSCWSGIISNVFIQYCTAYAFSQVVSFLGSDGVSISEISVMLKSLLSAAAR